LDGMGRERKGTEGNGREGKRFSVDRAD